MAHRLLLLIALSVAIAAGPGSGGLEQKSFYGSATSSQDLDSLEKVTIRGDEGRRLDSLMKAFEGQGFNGVVLLVRRRQIVLANGYGYADTTRRIRNSPGTRFELNSITKSFTGAAVLRLASEGKLGIDDSLGKFFGDFPREKSSATVRQLALHTAGLVVAGTALASDSRQHFIDDLKRTPLESPPGSAYRYTNAGYSALAAVIEVASGQSFNDYLRTNILDPAGLRHSKFADELPSGDTLYAKGYSTASNPYTWGRIGAAGVWATAGDVYRWVVALKSGTIVQGPLARLLWIAPPPPSQEAFGWHVFTSGDTVRRIEKGGGSADFATQLLYFPRADVTIVWASNDVTKRWRQLLNDTLIQALSLNR